jgi:hypothetical protein
MVAYCEGGKKNISANENSQKETQQTAINRINKQPMYVTEYLQLT